MTTSPSPPVSVLAAFGADDLDVDACKLLDGGRGTTWRCGRLIIKPSHDSGADRWIANVMHDLRPTGYRVPVPVRASTGDWVHRSWCAWRVVPGAHGSGGQWSVILPVAQALLADLERLSRPGFLDRRTDHWARGDRVAWSHSVELQQPPFNALTNRLVDLREDENLPSQVIHSDIYGNVLFHPHAAPAVIDLSPMWRPAGYCLAIAAVDAIAWYSAPRAILNDLLDLKSVRSLLARAAIFRLATADRFAATSAEQTHYVTSTVTEFTPVIEAIENL